MEELSGLIAKARPFSLSGEKGLRRFAVQLRKRSVQLTDCVSRFSLSGEEGREGLRRFVSRVVDLARGLVRLVDVHE